MENKEEKSLNLIAYFAAIKWLYDTSPAVLLILIMVHIFAVFGVYALFCW